MTESLDATAPAAVKMERAPGRALAGKIATSDLADELLERARADGTSLVGPGGLLADLTKRVLESVLEAELTEHVGYEPYDPAGHHSGNSRNGTRSKTVITEIGPIELEVPRDRAGTFEPVIVPKRKRRSGGWTRWCCRCRLRGSPTGRSAPTWRRSTGPRCPRRPSPGSPTRLLEAWPSGRTARSTRSIRWCSSTPSTSRSARARWPTGRSMWRSAVTIDGERDILGLWAGDGGEGAKYWAHVLTEIKNRGVADVCIVVCDGLTGLPDAVAAVWPQAIVQNCVVHLLRNQFPLRRPPGLAGDRQGPQAHLHRPDRGGRPGPLRRVRRALGGRYPAIVKLWENAWAEFVPFLELRPRGPPPSSTRRMPSRA